MSDRPDLAALRALAEAATPGPWIRPWRADYLHAPGTDAVLNDRPTLDYLAACSLERILALIAEVESLRTMSQQVTGYGGVGDPEEARHAR